jgi:hypothetical protein
MPGADRAILIDSLQSSVCSAFALILIFFVLSNGIGAWNGCYFVGFVWAIFVRVRYLAGEID